MDEIATDGETITVQNADVTEQHLKQSADTAAGTSRSPGFVKQDTKKAKLSPASTTHVQAAIKVCIMWS